MPKQKPKTKNVRIDLPLKYHRGLRKMIGEDGTKKQAVTEIVMREIIRGGYVKPSKIELAMCGIED
ncbi:MAG: hypothetical protein MIO92_03730 [Methanosarcinaceae archaeon]|nr:hypothetical protein [Methanosarcinaceae archaeon]